MKRYRVALLDFDTRATARSVKIKEDWDPQVQQLHRQNQQQIDAELAQEYGARNFEAKRERFLELGAKPFSVLAYHNRFQDQIRRAYVIGAYYPALVGACALGERILNHLILALRSEYRRTPEYRKVHRKKSLDDWELMIRALEAWQVLLPEVASAFRRLHRARNDALHFRPEVDTNDRELAGAAIQTLTSVIAQQFGAGGAQPWFIPNPFGETLIRRSAEGQPFIQLVYLPNCMHVGPRHRVKLDPTTWRWQPIDEHQYEERDITDEEYVRLRAASLKRGEHDDP